MYILYIIWYTAKHLRFAIPYIKTAERGFTTPGFVKHLSSFSVAQGVEYNLMTAWLEFVKGPCIWLTSAVVFFFFFLQEYEILWQIRQLQASCSQYTLPDHPQIAAWLQHRTLLTDQER